MPMLNNAMRIIAVSVDFDFLDFIVKVNENKISLHKRQTP